MKKYLVIVIGFLMIVTQPVYAKTFKWGTGGTSGNYFGMGNDSVAMCTKDLGTDKKGQPNEIAVESSNGSEQNLIGLTNKKYAVATVQEDVLRFHNKKSPGKINGNRIRILLDAHEETGHLLFPIGWQPKGKKKGMFTKLYSKVKKEKPKPISINLLKGQVIGSMGGSMVSAEALSMFLDLRMKVVKTTPDQMLSKADKPILLVGGQPYKLVEDLLATGKYMLVGIDANTLKNRAPFYTTKNANYSQNGKMTTVPTFGVRALIVGKYFRSKAKNKVMKDFASCLFDSLGELADDDDTNPNWESVYELNQDNNRIDWRYFNKMKDTEDEDE